MPRKIPLKSPGAGVELTTLLQKSELRRQEVLRLAYKLRTLQARADREHAALVVIIDALNANSEPCHYKIREAIELARAVLTTEP